MTIAVDFDGTLAQYEGYKGVGVYGEPVLSMLERVRRWVAEGREVVIFTARVAPRIEDDGRQDWSDSKAERYLIQQWLIKHKLPRLEVTCIKHKRIKEFWDDRAVSIETNTGQPISYENQ